MTEPGVGAVVVSDEKIAKQWCVANLGFEVQDDDELGRLLQHHAYYDPAPQYEIAHLQSMERAQPLVPHSSQDLV